MWRIYLLFSLLLTIYIGLVILAYGIKTTVRIDVNNLSLCVKIFIFDWIEVFCFKIFVSEQQFYYQINKKDIKLFERKGQDRKSKKKRAAPPKKIGIGSTVKVNGRLHLDSYGRGPGMYEKNATRQVIYIVPGRKYPVCVGIGGIARGWVKRSEVKRV